MCRGCGAVPGQYVHKVSVSRDAMRCVGKSKAGLEETEECVRIVRKGRAGRDLLDASREA